MNLDKILSAIRQFAEESVTVRILSSAVAWVILMCLTLIALGFAAAFHACKRFLLLPALLVLLVGCATVPPCRCVCAPAPDPRVHDLQAEVDRGQAELVRLRDRIRANTEAEGDVPPVWVFPKIQPEGGAK